MDYAKLSGEFLQTVHRFQRIRAQQQISESMHGEAFALFYVAQHDGTTIPSDICNVMGVSSARIATVLNGLENKGFITRQIDPRDRRRTILKLTPAGEEQAAQNTQQLQDSVTQMLEYLGEHDAKEYVRIIGRLADKHIKGMD